MLTCIHADSGLCPRCQADLAEDPAAWLEFGDHPEGIARQRALQAEMDAARDEVPCDIIPDDVPF